MTRNPIADAAEPAKVAVGSTNAGESADPNRLVTVPELAAHWGVSRAHVYNLISVGLPTKKIGRARRIRIAEADAWLDAINSQAA
ncbi:hypothetical protein BH10ACT1_BH10ACT1_19900 [soil metagenome]